MCRDSFSRKNATILVGAVTASFNWQLPEGEEIDLSEKFGIVLKKRTPLVAIPTKRLSTSDLYL